MSDDEMYEGIEEIVDGYIKEGKNLKEIYREVFDSFKTAEDKVILELLRTESKLYTIEFLNACRTYCENIDRESAYKRLIQKYEEWESSVIYFMKYIYELEEQGEEKL